MPQLHRARHEGHRNFHQYSPRSEGTDMTLIDTLPPRYTQHPPREVAPRTPRRYPSAAEVAEGRRRPSSSRPATAPMRRSGTGVLKSRAPHRRRRTITPVTTVGLALLAALITVWLGAVAQFGAAIQGATVPEPGKLAVVQVQMGETLQTVAARIAPDLPVGQTVERIVELNQLNGAAINAGQTLIAPVG